MLERALLEGLGGTCHSPIAALTDRDGGRVHLRVAIYSPDGAVKVEDSADLAPDDHTGARDLAQRLLEQAPEHVRVHFGGAK